jgi:hypothetical protein
MKVILAKWNTWRNESFGMHSIGQYMSVIPPNSNTLTIESFGMHSIGQYM